MSQNAYHNITKYIVYSLVGATLVSAFLLTNFKGVFAEDTHVANASVTVSATCSMTANVNTAHTATMVNGTYSSGAYPGGIGETTIKTFCNDPSGYAIYAIGFSGDKYGNTDMIGAGLDASYNIKTGTATSGSGTNDVSNWAMKISAVAGTYAPTVENGFGNFSAVPSEYTKVASFNGITDAQSTNIGSSITTTYAAYVANAQPAGTYTGQVKYALVHPSSADAPELPNPITDAFFAAGKEKYKGYYKMQDMTASICASVATPTTTTEDISAQLIDTRDDKIYWVSKLKDGKCWMTQNLDLDLSTTKELTSADTNLPEGSSWTPDKNTVVGDKLSSSNWATSSDYTHQFSWDGGNYYLPDGRDKNNTACTNKNLGACTNDVTSIAALTDASIKGNVNAHYHIGNLYTWTAALAMNDSGSVDTTSYTNPVSTSICPKGWRLPTAYGGNSSTNGEFKNLNIAYGNITNKDDTLRAAPLFFARSGYVYTGSLYNVGSYGYYWSSTVYSSNSAYYLNFYSTYVNPTNSRGRNLGNAVRCVAQ